MRGVGGIALAILAGLLLVALFGGTYVVDEHEQVVITRFGNPVRAVATPGLKLKVPFVETVNRFDKRFLEWDGASNQLTTKDKRFIYVDTYARWRISDPIKFFQRLRGEERLAQSRLDDILDGETRNAIANHALIEVVRSTNRDFAVSEELGGQVEPGAQARIDFGRATLQAEVLGASQGRTEDLGIEILDFRFKRINYVEEVRREVYARMISERQRIAEQFRSEGAGESARINGERERELKTITSEAYREAEEIKGRADAEAAGIYASAYDRDPEFYQFRKSMDVLQATLGEHAVLLLGTDGELLRYLEHSK